MKKILNSWLLIFHVLIMSPFIIIGFVAHIITTGILFGWMCGQELTKWEIKNG